MAEWQQQEQRHQQSWAVPQGNVQAPWGNTQNVQYGDPSWNTQAQQPWNQQQQWSGVAPVQQQPTWGATASQPFAQAQQPQYQQQQAPPQVSQAWAPDLSAMDLGDPMLNVAVKGGAELARKHAKDAAADAMHGVTSFWGSMRKYFEVNNSFVVKKLYTILFPFVKKDWDRTPTMESPANDPNSPDLYIPLMALSTYVLTVGLAKGSSMTFNPEVIVDTFGTSVMIQVVQVALIRVAQMTLVPWVPALPWLELVAYTGYLFTGVAINMLAGLLFGSFVYNLTLLWTATCAAFGIYQTMRSVVPPPEPGQRGKRRRVNFFIVVAVLQVFVMWFLGYTRELKSAGIFSMARSAGESLVPPAVGKGANSMIPPPERPDVIREAAKIAEEEPSSRIKVESEGKPVVDRGGRDAQPQRGGGNRRARRNNQQAAGGDAADV